MRTDMTKPTVAFCNFANALKKCGLSQCLSLGGPSLSTERGVTSWKQELPQNNTNTNAHSCKTRILKTQYPCFSYYGIPFWYEITEGKMNKAGRHNEVTSRLSQFSERAPVLRHGTLSSQLNSLPVTVRKMPVQWPVTKTYSHCVRSHNRLYIYIHTHTLPSNHHAVSTGCICITNTSRKLMS
jgi:hypothetical protein